jgi:hypothetical protein
MPSLCAVQDAVQYFPVPLTLEAAKTAEGFAPIGCIQLAAGNGRSFVQKNVFRAVWVDGWIGIGCVMLASRSGRPGGKAFSFDAVF